MKTRSSRVASIQSLPDTVRTTATMNRALQHVRSTMDICNRQRRTRSSPVGGVQILPCPLDLDCSSDSRCRLPEPGQPKQGSPPYRGGGMHAGVQWPPAGSCCGHLSSAPAPGRPARLRPTSFAAGKKNRGRRPTAVAVAAVKTWRGADLTGRALAASIVAAW